MKTYTIIDQVLVQFIQNTTVQIIDVLHKGALQMRFKIIGTGFLSGKYGQKNFELLWKNYQYWLRCRKLEAQKIKYKLKEWIENSIAGDHKVHSNNTNVYFINRRKGIYYS